MDSKVEAEDFTGFCMALGYIGQNWAMMEQNLDMWIAWIYHDLGGRLNINPMIPVSFKRKVEFLRRAFRILAPLKHLASEANELLTRASDLVNKRNDLMHGALSSLSPVDGKWHMIKFDFETPKDREHWHVVREFTFSPTDFQEIEAKLVPLAGETAKFGHRLVMISR